MTEHNRDKVVAIINGTHLCLLVCPQQQQQKQPTTTTAATKSRFSDSSTSTSIDEEMSHDDNHNNVDTDEDADADKTTQVRGTTVVPVLSIRFVPMLLNQRELILHCSNDNTIDFSGNYCDLVNDSSDRDYDSDIVSQAFIHNNYWREFTIDNQLIDECFIPRCHGDAVLSNGKIHLQCPHCYYLQQQEQRDISS